MKNNKIKLKDIKVESFKTTATEKLKGGLYAMDRVDTGMNTEFMQKTCAPYPCVPQETVIGA
ncbi:MAG: hypothetical protein WBB45_01025 [Cyclobacteriaceae bacterium]